MNNVLISLKKFFTNKNVVTVIGVLIILILLYVGYNYSIEQKTKPVKIPVVVSTIQPRTLITDNMIKYISVPSAALSSNVIRNSSAIVGMYTDVNTVIPAGSMFYKDVLVKKEELPDSAFTAVKDGERPYALNVNMANTYGNSIFPGNMIDIYMKATDETGQVMVGRLLAKVKVLAVKDNSGNNVFEDTSVNRIPSTILYGVEEKIYILLKKAEYLKSFGVEVFPVPYGGTAQIEGSLEVDRAELVNFIESKTVSLSESQLGGSTPEQTPSTDNNQTPSPNNNRTGQ